MPAIERFYFDAPFGQLHGRRLAANGEAKLPALLCLHPAPYSGAYFTTVMPLLNNGRDVIALDYPGYGGSDATDGDLSIELIAAAIGAFINNEQQPLDLLGFHTGCLVAVELARGTSAGIRRIILCDVPFFSADAQAGLRQKMANPLPVTHKLESLSGAWDVDVRKRIADLGLQRTFELFVEHLRAAPNDHLAFAAAFSYDCERRFGDVDGDFVVIATQSGLRDATIAAHATLGNAQLIEANDITAAVFETGAHAIARHIEAALED